MFTWLTRKEWSQPPYSLTDQKLLEFVRNGLIPYADNGTFGPEPMMPLRILDMIGELEVWNAWLATEEEKQKPHTVLTSDSLMAAARLLKMCLKAHGYILNELGLPRPKGILYLTWPGAQPVVPTIDQVREKVSRLQSKIDEAKKNPWRNLNLSLTQDAIESHRLTHVAYYRADDICRFMSGDQSAAGASKALETKTAPSLDEPEASNTPGIKQNATQIKQYEPGQTVEVEERKAAGKEITFSFYRKGSNWFIGKPDDAIPLLHSKGLARINYLLSRPNKEIHVTELEDLSGSRSSVTESLRKAIATIQYYDSRIGDYLSATIHTGDYLKYNHNPEINWILKIPTEQA